MNELADIPELVAAHENGEFDEEYVHVLLFDLLVDHEVEAVLALLSEPLRRSFEQVLPEFGDHVALDDIYIFSSGRGDHPDKAQIVATVRRWLRSRGERQGG